jgi:hypothetical protein
MKGEVGRVKVTMTMRMFVSAGVIASLCGVAAAQQPMTLRPRLDSAKRLSDWTLDGSGSWEIAGGRLVLAKEGKPAGPIRRPAALAILKSPAFGRVTLEAEVRSTAPADLKVRDVLLIVGYESPTRFYYVHLSGVTDGVHNGIFLVNEADRRRIDDGKGEPQLKDQAWHRTRLERDPSTGRIEVFVDGSEKPVLHATDTTIAAGRVGLGSFDETGEFRAITVKGPIK